MNKSQLQEVLDYMDCEYAGIVSGMTDDEKRNRAKHWAKEIGSLDFSAVMNAVRKLARGQFMPRTGEVLREVEAESLNKGFDRPMRSQYWWKPKCRIWQGNDGKEYYDYQGPDSSESMHGLFSALPEWMQLKFRWLAEPTTENTEAWENYIFAHEERDDYRQEGMFPEVDALMALV